MNTVATSGEENAIIVGVITGASRRKEVGEYLEELALLADTAGVAVLHQVTQERSSLDPATYIGKGKAADLAALVEKDQIDLVIFDDDLSPVQIRNLEKVIKCKLLDRSGLILDIFAGRAKSKEAMTQVELAQLQYHLPRLTRQWTHLSKQYGGVGTKGPGETQIETDRRAIRSRIKLLKEKLRRISKEREVQRKGRTEFPRVAMVGYTNAGKSTLMNALSGSDVLVEDRLFATLDTTIRKVALKPSRSVLLSDTVGFIRKLPPNLIASFRSTLAEVSEADILLHVIDISHPSFEDQITVVQDTLDTLDAAGKPTIYVFNKVDRMPDRSRIHDLAQQHSPAVFISASRGINLEALRVSLLEIIELDMREETFILPQADSRIVAKLHEITEVLSTVYEEEHVTIRVRVSRKNAERLAKLMGHSGLLHRKEEPW